MKKILPAILIVFTTASLQAQITRIDTAKNQNILLKSKQASSYQQYFYSFGVRVYGYEQFPAILNQTDPKVFKSIPLTGVFVKFNDNQISYRIAGNFYNKNISFNNECVDCELTKGKLTDYSIKLGFEKTLTYSIIQPYFGFDLGFRNNRFKGSSQNIISLIAFTAPYTVIAEKNSGVFAPVLGLKFNLINHFVIGTEASIDFLRSYERQTKIYQDAARSQTIEKSTQWEYLLRPVTAFVQFNFGATD